MKPITRDQIVSYVRSSIDNVKETTTQPWHKHDWQKKQSANFIKENEAFLDKFESRPGEVHEILEASDKKIKRRGFWAGTTAVAGLGLAVATGVVGAAMIGPASLAVGMFAASNALCLGGVAAANLVNRGEEQFSGKLESFTKDIREDKTPGIASGTYHRPVYKNSDDDDDFMSLNINSQGKIGYNLGIGTQLGFDGKVHSSF